MTQLYNYIVETNSGEYLKYDFLEDESFTIGLTKNITKAHKYFFPDEIEMDFEFYLFEKVEEIEPHNVLKVDKNNNIVAVVPYEALYEEYMNNDF